MKIFKRQHQTKSNLGAFYRTGAKEKSFIKQMNEQQINYLIG